MAEWANILWKKVRRGELDIEEAFLAGRLLQAADVELLFTRSLLGHALRLAVDLDHPAYDCLYLALAAASSSLLVTADKALVRRVLRSPRKELAAWVSPLSDIVEER